MCVVKKDISDVKLVVFGVGVVFIVCLNLLVVLGLKYYNIMVCDFKGVIYKGCEVNMVEIKVVYVIEDNG